MLLKQTVQALDLGKELPEPTDESRSALALSVASCLFQFLEALPEPLVPTHLHHVCAESPDREAAFEVRTFNRPFGIQSY